MSQVFRTRLGRLSYLGDERGATAVEYAMMVALVAVVIMASVSLLGGRLSSAFGSVDSAMIQSPASANGGGGGGGGSNGANNNGQGGGIGGGVGGGQGNNPN
jgi:pilus assembly protein Flp/PilA